jgi:hypothetical protein
VADSDPVQVAIALAADALAADQSHVHAIKRMLQGDRP